MNVIAHGVDFVETRRIGELIDRHGQRFLDRVFTPAEQGYCNAHLHRLERLAGRFAAKEAVLKALGTGWRGGIAWTDVEVTNIASGEPIVALSGQCAAVADLRGIAKVLVSISHIDSHAMASAIALGR
ncbi:MAG: holo-ACP synthase [Planctomycetes bacterium]|nr:holo-ACP synthase [Planctomycetota bacterium]